MSTRERQEVEEKEEATKEIPVLTVDESLSVEERLTDNTVNNILPARYLNKDSDGNIIETPAGMFERVAENIAAAEFEFDNSVEEYNHWADEFEQLMKTQRLMPNSPCLFNAGLELQQCSACFLLEPKDDMQDILKTVEEAGLIFKSGGGIGYAFSHLRPKGALVESTKGVSSGPISFMRLFDETCNQVSAGGKRRGAQMGVMRVDHPDIGRFAVAKRNEGDLDNFNISAGIIDDFKEAVQDDMLYTLYSPRSDFEEPFEMVEATQQFYSPEYKDSPEAVVDENLWRDHADSIEAWDWDNEETVSFREKWYDTFKNAAESGRFDQGEEMRLPARFIWDLLVDGAWRNGEPGCLYLDEVNRQHSFDIKEYPEYEIAASNPCLTGDTLISTDDGMVRADKLCEKNESTNVVVDGRLSDEQTKEASSVYKTGEKDVYDLQTREGFSLRLTADHRVMTDNGWVEAQNLDEGDTVHIQNRKGGFGKNGSAKEGRVLGWLVGDGHLKHGEERAVLNFYDQDTELSETFAEEVNDIIREPNRNRSYTVGVSKITTKERDGKEERVRSMRLYETAESFDLTDEKLQVPDDVMSGSKEMAQGFLSALFTADGCIQGTKGKGFSVRLATVSEELAESVQQLLLNFGINSTVYYERREAGMKELPDGKGGTSMYETQAFHEVSISADNIQRFREEIGFLRSDKIEDLDSALESYTEGPYHKPFEATVESVEFDGNEQVYDLTEPNTNSFIGNGIVVHNCGEQFLVEYESCTLAHINLSLILEEDAPAYDEYVESVNYDYHTTSAKAYDYFEEAVDFDELDRVIDSGTRFLDNVLTMNDYPLDELQKRSDEMRKIGLGVMGWAQMCYQMGVRYGSEESLQIARVVMSYIDEKSTEYSHKLAKERGSFGLWDESKYADPEEYPDWFKKHAHQIPEEWGDGYPVRNHNTTTVAPCGTSGMIADTTGGIEPVFSVAYKKNVGNDIQGDEMLVEFDKVFLKTLRENEADLDHTVDEIKEIAAEQMSNNDFDGVSGLPVPEFIKETFVTTNDIQAEEHVKMQRVFQESVSSSISKTINAPSDAKHKDVHDAYMLALSDDAIGSPSKGITVYRNQSREEQVKTTQEYNDLEVENAKEMLEDLGYTVTGGDGE